MENFNQDSSALDLPHLEAIPWIFSIYFIILHRLPTVLSATKELCSESQ
jgi:hypothetical protein